MIHVLAEVVRSTKSAVENNSVLEHIVGPLNKWFYQNARELPWRNTKEAYSIWISEIMLQQTRVEAVKGYYSRFLEALPSLSDLAQAEEDVLLKLWEGLGYYNRVRNMQKAARVIMEEYNGIFPSQYEQILSLPGIGSYTAGAIGSIAFDLPVPAVDGNVLRVLSRVLGSYEDIAKPSAKKKTEEMLLKIMPEDEPGVFNQALMELGATHCGPNWEPRCNECPLKDLCQANLKGIANELPVKTPKKPRRIEEKTILILFDGERIALQKRPEKGLLAGLYEFPKLQAYETSEVVLEYVKMLGFSAIRIQETESSKHIFSHVEWHMKAYMIRVEDFNTYKNQGEEQFVFADLEDVNKVYAVPSAFTRYKELLKGLL